MQGLDIKPVQVKQKNRLEHNPLSGRHNPKNKNIITDTQTIKILQEVERLLAKGQNLECINLLRALKDNMQGVKNHNLQVLVVINLGILFYQVGFLQQANQQLTAAATKLRQYSQKALPFRSKDAIRIKYQTILGKIQLQLCILFSEMGKHDQALEHARTSSKICYNLIYDIQAKQHSSLNKLLVAKNYQKQEFKQISLKEASTTINNIAVLNHLLNSTKDFKLAFLQKQKATLLEEQIQNTRKYGSISPKIDLQVLYPPQERAEHLWVYKNKILDEIQLVPFELSQLEDLDPEISSNEVIQKITYLAISLYCFSTQTRFLEKQKIHDSNDVLDSQHWLSRSLEIAYSFMPAQAPILNQIITVHDRFHGLDKQTIPEDQQVTGFFKVLKPLSKPKSTYNSKNPGSSPIMIRIQADKVDVQMDSTAKTHRENSNKKNIIDLDHRANNTIDLDTITKNNRIRNYSHGHKRIDTAELGKPSLSSRTTIDIPQLHNPNVRANYANKKFSKKKDEKLKVNFSQLNGKAVISQDLLARPKSIEQTKTINHDGHLRVLTDKRKRSVPNRRSELSRKGNSNPIKFEGLQLKGHKLEEGVDTQFFQRLNNEPRMVQTARMGGNVYINNNINLFISKNAQPFTQTFVRGQVAQQKQKDKEGTRRQMFLNKRRPNNFIAQDHQE